MGKTQSGLRCRPWHLLPVWLCIGDISRVVTDTSVLRSAHGQWLQESTLLLRCALGHCHLRRVWSGLGSVPWRMQSVTFLACSPLSFSHGRNLGVSPSFCLASGAYGLAWGQLQALTMSVVCVLWRSAPVLSPSFPLLMWGSCMCAWVWPGCQISDVVHLVFWDWVSPWLGCLDISRLSAFLVLGLRMCTTVLGCFKKGGSGESNLGSLCLHSKHFTN